MGLGVGDGEIAGGVAVGGEDGGRGREDEARRWGRC